MPLTPVEIRHIRLRKSLSGYQRTQVDELMGEIADSFEDVWRDRADLADKVEQLEAEIVRFKEIEQLLRTTLISAERAGQQMTDQARREAETVLNEARVEAREIIRAASAARESLLAETTRIKAQLSAVLETVSTIPQSVGATPPAANPAAPAPTPRPQTQPPASAAGSSAAA